MSATALNYLIIIVSGLIIGSFLNVVILRFDNLKSIFLGHSQCPHCNRKLIWYELIPVLSFIALQGKCRNCKKIISIQYPLVEAGTALIFALLFWKFGLTLEFIFLALISCFLMVIFVYDILKQEISDLLVIIAAVLWIIYLAINFFILHSSFFILLNSFYGALALGGFFGLLAGLSKEKWMGYGDIGMGALLGFILGWPLVLFGSFSAFFLGALLGIGLIIFGFKKLQSKLPFAPFLIIGFWLALFWGENIVNWYTNLIM